MLKEQVQQLKQANEQLVHDNDILTDQLRAKDEQIASAHQLADQAQKLHLGMEQQMKMLTESSESPVVDGETTETNNKPSKDEKPAQETPDTKKATSKSWWHFW